MRTTFFVLIILFFSCSGYGQSCLPAGITLSSQAEVDNFSNNYPGCTSIEGLLSITGDINNLNGLSVLTSVGALSIESNWQLSNLNGLNNLSTVEGNFSVSSASGLSNLSGLDNLASIGGTFLVGDNDNMLNLQGLEKITSLPSEVMIDQNSLLKSLSGLENLKTVGGSVVLLSNYELLTLTGLDGLQTIGGGIYLHSNIALPNISHLTQLATVGGSFSISGNYLLEHVDSLPALTTVGGNLAIGYNPILTDISGFYNLTTVGQNLAVIYCSALSSLHGLEHVTVVKGDLQINDNLVLTSLSDLPGITRVEGNMLVASNSALTGLNGLHNLTRVGNDLQLENNPAMTQLNGLENLDSIGGSLSIKRDSMLTSLEELGNLSVVSGSLLIENNKVLTSLHGLEKISALPGECNLSSNAALTDLNGLNNLATVGNIFGIAGNASLTNLSGLESLRRIGGYLGIAYNASLINLQGLHRLDTIEQALAINENPVLSSLLGLDSLAFVGTYLQIRYNPLLSDCAVQSICELLFLNPDFNNVDILDNGPGCNNQSEIHAGCGGIPVHARVLLDSDGNCVPDTASVPAPGVLVQLAGYLQMVQRPTQADGSVDFEYFNYGEFTLSLPQFPTENWALCHDTILIDPALFPDTISATFLFLPQNQCPKLAVDLDLPPSFRGCLVESKVQVRVGNVGTIVANGAKVAVVLPPTLDLLDAVPPPTVQNGDTLFFELGDLLPFVTTTVKLTVKTDCDSFLLGRTLCLEAFAALANPCPDFQPGQSKIKVSGQCLGDSIVRFTLKNVGDGPTLAAHSYTLIRNENILSTGSFSLDVQQSQAVDVLADGATYRMEATKYEDGTLTATAIENCRELTPGLITAFWFDRGPLEYDFDCRQAINSFDPNLKSVLPTGLGQDQHIVADRPLQYTIDFQNTGADTAFRVLLRDILGPNLDVSSFRPGFASHPYTWEIRGLDTLEVLFFPIMLPDSNVNEAASHGFFTFGIDQKPSLPDGSVLENTADIVFDFNPPITTNTVRQTIGQLTVQVDEPQAYAAHWQVLGNPTRDAATFRTKEFIAGEKRFDLYDASGRLERSVQFSGQEFEFLREGLGIGLYFFKISDMQGRVFAGKIAVAE